MAFRKKIKKIFAKRFLIFVPPFLFLIFGVLTIPDYGINWDEPFHFNRGQAYLHYFFSGKQNFLDLPAYPVLKGSSDFVGRLGENEVFQKAIKSQYDPTAKFMRSYFQSDIYTYESFLQTENGHPPTSDIFAAFTNYLFYQRLKIMDDIDSYHLSEVLISSLIVFAVSFVVYKKYGILASLVSSSALSLYPLFFSESHFNIKDPAVASFYGLSIIFFYLGVTKHGWKDMILSGVFAAFGLGTKFNVFFIIPTLGVWILAYLFLTKQNKKRVVWIFLFSFVALLTTASVFYALWPYLWQDPIGKFTTIFRFYREIGLGTPPELNAYIFRGWNFYPIVWIFYTTPIPILIFASIGFLTSIFLSFFRKDTFALLVLTWFLIPVLRVSYPGTSIYGGVRQIMEYIPPLAILSGIGAMQFSKLVNRKRAIYVLVFISFTFVVYELARLHPNENVYFNQIIGGLSGAKGRNVPYWGNSYGNVYLQGVKWLNANSEPNAKLGLPIANMGNIPRTKLRRDIEFSNANWSGPNRLGEYEMELDFDWGPKVWYSYAYYDVFLEPVYEVLVDQVPILKVWKNDLAHTRSGYEKQMTFSFLTKTVDEGKLQIDMGKEIFLTEVRIKHSSVSCTPQKGGYIALSQDKTSWQKEPEAIDYPQVPPAAVGINENNFVYLFAAKKTRYILLDTQITNSCILKNPQITIKGLEGLP